MAKTYDRSKGRDWSKISVVAHYIGSARDIYGNRYWAAIFYRCADRAIASGKIDAPCNVRVFDQCLEIEESLPIREWERLTKKWPYLSGSFEEVAKGVYRQWREYAKANKQ